MAPASTRRLAVIVFCSIAVAFLLAEWVVAGAFGPPLDDGWIYMAFARSFALGEGVTYPGYDGPIASVTGPVWCFLLGAAFFVFGPGVFAAKLLGVVAGLLALGGVYRLGKAATGDELVGAVAALVTAVSARYAWGALSGMEVPFYVGAVTFGLALHIERVDDGFRRWWPAVVLLWLAGWARPECFVFVVLAVLHRRRLGGIAFAGALLALYPLYHLAVYGHPLPTTFYAKAAGDTPLAILRHDGLFAAAASLLQNVSLEVVAFGGYLPTWLPFLAPGLILGVRNGLRERNGVPTIAAFLLVFVIARGALGFSGPWFQHGRYFAHAWPMFAILCLHGMDLRRTDARPAGVVLGLLALAFAVSPKGGLLVCWDWLVPPFLPDLDSSRATLVFVPAAITLVLAAAGVKIARDGRVGRPPVWACALYLVPAIALGAIRHGQGVRDTYALNVAMAQRVREVVPEGDLVACHDIGALGYFADRRLLDLAGLGSPEVVFRPRAPGAPRDLAAILSEQRPQWLCLTEDMAAMLNPTAGGIEGLRGARLVETIRLEENVTVAGSVYHLAELEW